MIITITEFKSNIDMYLELASTEDIIITKYGKTIARLTEPKLDKMAILNSLVGIAKGVGIGFEEDSTSIRQSNSFREQMKRKQKERRGE